MMSMIGKLASFARTPAGQRALRTATTKAQELAKDPRTMEKVTQVRERLQGQASSRSRGDESPPEAEQADQPDTARQAPDVGQRRTDGPTDRS